MKTLILVYNNTRITDTQIDWLLKKLLESGFKVYALGTSPMKETFEVYNLTDLPISDLLEVSLALESVKRRQNEVTEEMKSARFRNLSPKLAEILPTGES